MCITDQPTVVQSSTPQSYKIPIDTGTLRKNHRHLNLLLETVSDSLAKTKLFSSGDSNILHYDTRGTRGGRVTKPPSIFYKIPTETN